MGAKQDVGGFDVGVDYALRVKPGETGGKGASERWEDACDGGCAACFGQGGEGG